MIKVLKAISIIIGSVAFILILMILGMFDSGEIKNFWVAAGLIFMSFIVILIARLGYWILEDHGKNTDWLDYLNDIAKEE